MKVVKIIYLCAHGDVIFSLDRWIKQLPIDIKYYVCIMPEWGCVPVTLDNVELIDTEEKMLSILDDNTIIIGYNDEVCDSVSQKVKCKIACYPHTIHFSKYPVICHSIEYVKQNNTLVLYIHKLIDYKYESVPIESRHNYYSYIRNYQSGFRNSYPLFLELHRLIKSQGIALINYGYFKNSDGVIDRTFDVLQEIYCPRSKATVHLKETDHVSNTVCKSIYFKTPVLTLTADYKTGWHDSIDGIYKFDTVKEIAEFIFKIEHSFEFYREIMEEVSVASIRNNMFSPLDRQMSLTWIKSVMEE